MAEPDESALVKDYQDNSIGKGLDVFRASFD